MSTHDRVQEESLLTIWCHSVEIPLKQRDLGLDTEEGP